MNQKRGFTLIELLVVISIIALLMSMLMPALARVRKQAKAVACQMELKQWATVWNVYFNENNNLLVDNIHWPGPLRPYYEDVDLLKCPSATKTQDEGGRSPYVCWSEPAETKARYGTGTESVVSDNPGLIWIDYAGSYNMNGWCMSIENNNRLFELIWITPDVKQGDRIPLLLDGGGRSFNTVPLPEDEPPMYDGEIEAGDEEINRVCINRHEGGINVLYLDMSVRKTTLKGLWDIDWSKYWRENDVPEPDWPDWIEAIN